MDDGQDRAGSNQTARSMPEDKLYVTIALDTAGERLDRALTQFLAADRPELSRSRLKTLIGEGAVTLAGAVIREPSRRVKPGERYAVAIPAVTQPIPVGQAIALSILDEDDQIIVIDKPAGLVVHPAPGNPDRTLVNALIAHCGASLTGVGGVGRPGIVHRLDKDTSGLMVAAKTDLAHQSLTRQFAGRSVERVYAAIVRGLPPLEGTIDRPIGRSRGDRKKMAVVAGGRSAVTSYKVIKVLADGAASLIECRLMTGRTHQIRVHLAAIGHPLLGDPSYGGRRRGDAVADLAARFGRQALDAFVLGFDHPRSAERRRYTKSYASDFKLLLDSLEELSTKRS
jgi:23S rRNA pseudouridine1911/1915/1917 synthase